MDHTRTELHRALDDLGKGVRALLGLGESSPDLVRELLHGGPEADRHECCDTACHSAPPRQRPSRSRPRRRPASHLVLIK